jgi:hypothetical protein
MRHFFSIRKWKWKTKKKLTRHAEHVRVSRAVKNAFGLCDL